MSDDALVLVVDDDDALRGTVARQLRRHGYAVVEARDAADGRAAMDETADIAAVLCDIQMPGQSGMVFLQELSLDFGDVAVVMMTGIDDPRTADLAFAIGAFGYVVKPFEPNEVLVALAGALRRRELERARQNHTRELERAVFRRGSVERVVKSITASSSVALSVDEDTIERLGRALSLRDEETGRHIERMSRYCALLANTTGFDGVTSDELRVAAALHDVGKIGVPDSVLQKPATLSPEERMVMQRHPQMGYQLLANSPSPLLDTAAAVAFGHHEWWDGGGYPRGAAGTDIPEAARIAAVADVFDALTSNRVYRPALPVGEALSIMEDLRGRQFEPRLFDVLVSVLDDVEVIREAYAEGPADDARVRILVVDDHEIFAQSLVRMLGASAHLRVVGAAGTVEEARTASLAHEPDVILMDFELPDGDGATATELIKALLPAVKVVMLTGRNDETAFVRAIAAGCAGFVTKQEAVDRLVEVIRAAHAGEAIDPPPGLRLTDLLGRLPPTRRGLGATVGPREIEVLGLVAAGLANKEIARQLSLSLHTVRNHVQSILYKLDTHSKLEAVATAVREGIIDYPREPIGA